MKSEVCDEVRTNIGSVHLLTYNGINREVIMLLWQLMERDKE